MKNIDKAKVLLKDAEDAIEEIESFLSVVMQKKTTGNAFHAIMQLKCLIKDHEVMELHIEE